MKPHILSISSTSHHTHTGLFKNQSQTPYHLSMFFNKTFREGKSIHCKIMNLDTPLRKMINLLCKFIFQPLYHINPLLNKSAHVHF